jgi:hypothetical protein
MTIDRTLNEVEDLMVSLVRLTLGIPDTDQSGIRLAYGASSETGGAPMHNPQTGVCYVYVDPTDDGYGQQHHITYKNGEDVEGDMTEVDEYTEEYAVTFSLYGHDAYDRARVLRDGLYGIAVKEFLWGKHIHPKMGIPAIVQAHEILNTFWVERCDVTVTFYAYVRIERENAVKDIEEVSVTLKHSPINTSKYTPKRVCERGNSNASSVAIA